MNNRRKFIVALGVGSLAIPRIASAQTTGRTYHLGWLASADLFKEPHYLAFVQRLTELGLVEGRNLSIERRQGDNNLAKLPALATELATLRCDVFFGGGIEANLAALVNASRDIPIVFVAVDFDPVAAGYVARLARPGGRVTGITALQSLLPAKRLEILKDMLPTAGKVAVFTNAEASGQLSVAEAAARRLGFSLHIVDFKRPPFDYEAGFADAVRAKVDAVFVLGSGLWVPGRRKIIDLALKARLPTVFHQFDWVGAGGLVSYGFNFPTLWRRGAEMAASILRGGKPSEIPMEQPTTYELAINLKTAKALRITIPDIVMVRATRVIE